ncbi:acyl carrier protein [Pseudoalteromonas umbrosa]|uniref:acyl carrier protein n=1 Tax=Pseudoalteromonas umbrosa TaxID=3048489 RepID=UPI0024C417D5|nr:acyl carrier protein [Pseudoalteromonas sp. B95]MDK1288220.1 acyl carrier protein [Pseudoalteromonas sp. B95]
MNKLPNNNDFTKKEIESFVSKKLAEILNSENFSSLDSIFDLGLNSIQVTFLVININDNFQVDIDVEDIIENQSVSSLSNKIDSVIKVNRLRGNFDEQKDNGEEKDKFYL